MCGWFILQINFIKFRRYCIPLKILKYGFFKKKIQIKKTTKAYVVMSRNVRKLNVSSKILQQAHDNTIHIGNKAIVPHFVV